MVAIQNFGKRLCIFLKVDCQFLLCSVMLRHPIHSNLEQHQDLISDYFKTIFLICKCIINVFTYTVVKLLLSHMIFNDHPPSAIADCDLQISFDLVFLLDSSSSVGPENFNEMTEFAADLVSLFQVGPSQVQIAAATFGNSVQRCVLLHPFVSFPYGIRKPRYELFNG